MILFRLLTGELPFRGKSQMLLVQILNEEPPALHKLDARLPRDVETICLKCLEKDPTRRYQSAAALAADLRRWLTGHPIEARPVNRTERAWRWCRRHIIATWLLLTLFLLLATIIFVGFREFYHQQREREHVVQRMANDAAMQAQEAKIQHESELRKQQTRQAMAIFHILDGVLRSADPLRLELQSPGTGDFLPATLAARRGGNSTDNIRNMLETATSQLDLLRSAPLRQAQLMQIIGRAYRSIGEHAEARRHLEDALRIRRDQLKLPLEEDVSLEVRMEGLAETLVDLGWTIQDYGDFERAEQSFQEALRIRIELHGPKSQKVAATQLHLGWLFADMNHQLHTGDKGEEAERLIRQAHQTLSQILGAGARETGIAQLELGTVLLMRAQHAEAWIALTQALAVLSLYPETRDLGLLHSRYLNASQLRLKARGLPDGQREKAQGFYNQSKQEYSTLIRDVELILGPRHPIVLMLMGDYAGLLRQKGDLSEAEAEIQDALARARQSPLCGHPFMIQAINELATAMRARGQPKDLEESRKLFDESLKYCRQRFDRSHPLYQETQRLAQEK